MAAKNLTTSWTWLDEDEIRGLTVDVDSGVLRWYDQIGCHCTDEDFWLQTMQEFRRDGSPPLMGELPRGVVAELEQALLVIEKG